MGQGHYTQQLFGTDDRKANGASGFVGLIGKIDPAIVRGRVFDQSDFMVGGHPSGQPLPQYALDDLFGQIRGEFTPR